MLLCGEDPTFREGTHLVYQVQKSILHGTADIFNAMQQYLPVKKNIPVIIEKVPVIIDKEKILRCLHIAPPDKKAGLVFSLIREAIPVARPKIIFKKTDAGYSEKKNFYIGSKNYEGIPFDEGNPAPDFSVPFLVTAGNEITKWAESFHDIFHRLCADEICNEVLNHCIKYFCDLIRKEYGTPFCLLFPGSSPSWPVEEQKKIYDLFGEQCRKIGIIINENYMIEPLKSVAGIAFPAEHANTFCEQCAYVDCEKRILNH